MLEQLLLFIFYWFVACWKCYHYSDSFEIHVNVLNFLSLWVNQCL
jgi:hypothetical protein